MLVCFWAYGHCLRVVDELWWALDMHDVAVLFLISQQQRSEEMMFCEKKTIVASKNLWVGVNMNQGSKMDCLA